MTVANKVGHCREGNSDKVYVASIVRIMENGEIAYKVVGRYSRIHKTMQKTEKGVFSSLSTAEAKRDSLFAEKEVRKGYINIEDVSYDGGLSMSDPWLSEYLAPELFSTPDMGQMGADRSEGKLVIDNEKHKVYELPKPPKSTNWYDRYEVFEFDSNLVGSADEFDKIVNYEAKKFILHGYGIVKPNTTGTMSPTTNDFVVLCVDASGLEDQFDENVTYVAENHPEEEMVYVYDKNGVKQEVFEERFRKGSESVRRYNER
jgi:hypothetical protein